MNKFNEEIRLLKTDIEYCDKKIKNAESEEKKNAFITKRNELQKHLEDKLKVI